MRLPDPVKLEGLFGFVSNGALDSLVTGLRSNDPKIVANVRDLVKRAEVHYWNKVWKGDSTAGESLGWCYVALGNYAMATTGSLAPGASLFFDAYQKFIELGGIKDERAVALREQHPEIEPFIESVAEKNIPVLAGSEF